MTTKTKVTIREYVQLAGAATIKALGAERFSELAAGKRQPTDAERVSITAQIHQDLDDKYGGRENWELAGA